MSHSRRECLYSQEWNVVETCKLSLKKQSKGDEYKNFKEIF